MKQPKDDGFENAWQEAFEKASLAPPEIIWKNIESALPTESLGVKPSAEGIATTSKLIIGTGIILISGLAYFYINNSSSNNYTTKTNQITNGKNITQPNEPAAVDSKIESENLAINSPIVAKKQFIPEIVKQELTKKTPMEEINTDQILMPEENIDVSKIEEKVYQMQPKGLKMPKITMDKPDLIPNTDSQIVVPYYDPNAIPSQQNNKGGFWRNFKISGGIRVSN